MTSILTNTSAMAALQSLRMVNSKMDDTQNRISTGLKVSSASDSPAYWSIATTMRSDSSMLSTVSDALGLGAAMTDTAYQGMNSAIDLVTQIKSKLTTAKEPGVDKLKINAEITSLKNQLKTTAAASSFNNQNWLYNSSSTAPASKDLVGSVNRDPTGTISLGIISVNTADTTLVDTNTASRGQLTKSIQVTVPVSASSTTTTTAVYFLINANSTTAAAAIGGQTANEITLSSTSSDFDITAMINTVDKVLSSLTDAATPLGTANAGLSNQNDFIKNMKASIAKGIGSIVDADMNEESSKLKALQTQQQLGIQALSIANSNSANVIALFR